MKKENWATDLLTNLAKIYADDVDVLEIIEDTINAAIASTKTINRLCEFNELPLFFQRNIEDRVEVAEFIRDVVVNVFENRKL